MLSIECSIVVYSGYLHINTQFKGLGNTLSVF